MTDVVDARQRLLVGRFVLEALRTYVIAYLASDDFGRNVVDIVILLGVGAGHTEGRAMSASDIAGFTGLPRSTVVRRIDALVAAGNLEVVKQGRRTTTCRR